MLKLGLKSKIDIIIYNPKYAMCIYLCSENAMSASGTEHLIMRESVMACSQCALTCNERETINMH